ncbi:MAG TPA: caspase family protein [Kofleriaceae bacterium]|nr:caspase family protein [Kofleriaceae bacterium]
MTVIDGQQPTTRDVGEAPQLTDTPARPARKYVVAIGIDQYQSWNRLSNAVNDARGALAAFRALGFQEFRPALIDGAATWQALNSLVINELPAIGTEDSLVLFFAGHGHTDRGQIDQGYLIPVDGASPGGYRTTWINLTSWLHAISNLPALHVFVILDACHSGIALDAMIRWRDSGRAPYQPLEKLRKLRSRRILTSAQGDQRALDGGPRAGHSLFTGCLIEALTGSLPYDPTQTAITGSELGVYVQKRVDTFPTSERQTPDFGALAGDDRGDLVIDLVPVLEKQREGDLQLGPRRGTRPPSEDSASQAPEGDETLVSRRPPTSSAGAPSAGLQGAEGDYEIAAQHTAPPIAITDLAAPVAAPAPSTPPATSPPAIEQTVEAVPPPGPQTTPSAPAWSPPPPWPPAPNPRGLAPAFITKLDLHHKARAKELVLSVVAADPLLALTGWALWSARCGQLTMVSDKTELEAVIADVLAQVPWLRALPAARACFATAAQLDARALDDALDRRSSQEREAWIEDIAGNERLPRVAGWLLAAFRETWASGPDLTTAPVQSVELLSALNALRAPISILLHHHAPSAAWLEQAIQTAAQLITFVPRLAVAIGAPKDLIHQVLRDCPDSFAFALARKGIVPLGVSLPATPGKPEATASAEHVLAHALAAHDATANLFLPNVPIPTSDSEKPVAVDLYAADALLAVQIDDWYRIPDRKSYRRAREPDRWLQRSGFFVTRFLAEDIEHRLERVVEEIALAVATRRAVEPPAEKPQ